MYVITKIVASDFLCKQGLSLPKVFKKKMDKCKRFFLIESLYSFCSTILCLVTQLRQHVIVAIEKFGFTCQSIEFFLLSDFGYIGISLQFAWDMFGPNVIKSIVICN